MWFYHRNINHKQSNAIWIGAGDCHRTVARLGRFEPKTMFGIFLRTTGLVHQSFIDKSNTIDSKLYVKRSLKQFLIEYKMRDQTLGELNLNFIMITLEKM